jgi:hypothetical protein
MSAQNLQAPAPPIVIKLIIAVGVLGSAALITLGMDRANSIHKGDKLVEFLSRIEPGKTGISEIKDREIAFTYEHCSMDVCERHYEVGPTLSDRMRPNGLRQPLAHAKVLIKNGTAEELEITAYAGPITIISRRKSNLSLPYRLSFGPTMVEQDTGTRASPDQIRAAFNIDFASVVSLRSGQANPETEVARMLPNMAIPATAR